MGWAVKVIGDPEQIVAGVDVNVILTGSSGFTIIRIWLLVAGLLVVHVSDDVSMHDTKSPFIGMYE